MSLSKLRKISEEGVEFSSHIDGSKHFVSPERSIEIQLNLGSDIIMAFDECVDSETPLEKVKSSMDRSMRGQKGLLLHLVTKIINLFLAYSKADLMRNLGWKVRKFSLILILTAMQ